MTGPDESFGINGAPESLPTLAGRLTEAHEEKESGGGGSVKVFAPLPEVREIFRSGIQGLSQRINETKERYHVEATIARIKFRSDGIAKSHRHPQLVSLMQVVGVERPGELLAIATPSMLADLSRLVRASDRYVERLSSVEAIEPYRPVIEMGPVKSVVTMFGGDLDDGTALEEQGLGVLEAKGVHVAAYGKLKHQYVAESLPSAESLEEMPWIRRVRPVIRVRTLGRVGINPIQAMTIDSTSSALPLPIIGITDSGIDVSTPWLKRLVVRQISRVMGTHSDRSHGTLVGSLAAAAGGQFAATTNPYPAPTARLLDLQVLEGSGAGDAIDEDDLLSALEDAVVIFGPLGWGERQDLDQPIVVWNLSMGADAPASEAEFSTLAHELDRISREQRVLFTLAAGNYRNVPLRGWDRQVGPDVILGGHDRISPPGDSALAVVVGSLSDTSSPPTAAPADCPSPFSRRGPGAGMLVKPDVVHYGGTCARDGQMAGAGVQGPAPGGGFQTGMGTSFAAPRVAAELGRVLSYLSEPEPEPELLKLLTLLSCETRGSHELDKRESVNYYGFGLVCDVMSVLECEPWESIVLLRGELRPGYSLRTPFPFPPGLTEDGLHRGRVRVVLVYTPWLDATKGAEYCQTNVSASLGRQFAYPAGDPRQYSREVPPIPREHGASYQFERDLIEHGWKWSPTKVYERTFTKMRLHPKEIGWRLSVELLLRRELEPYRDEVRQPFWLGVRFQDPERRASVYWEVRQQIELMSLAAPVILRPRLRV